MSTIFLTGFPGFLGSELLPRILSRAPGTRAVCLVQPHFAELARERIRAIESRWPGLDLAQRVEFVEGDITRSALGLERAVSERMTPGITEIYHLAAAYDLAIAREVGYRVNVLGTRNVLEFAGMCGRLTRFHYVSTCYVSGRHVGPFTEQQLAVGQDFNNFYEETKYLAEVEVQRSREAGLPTTIYRPAVVVGDSRSGETQKMDGPYFVIQWLLRQPRIAFMPVVGDPRATVFNMVPSDYVVKAITHLSGSPDAAGGVYHLADPDPLTVGELLDALALAAGRRLVRIPLSRTAARRIISGVPGVHRLMRMPAESVDYMVHPARYDTTEARRLLDPAGIRVPEATSYLNQLVDFARRHPGLGASAMT